MDRTALPEQGRDEAYALPSRRAALDACRTALVIGAGPVLVTGEAGVGKTWLAKRLATEGPAPGRWVVVDVTPASGALDFLRSIAHGLGLPCGEDAGALRLALADALVEWSADGRRWGLIIDEAHLAPSEVLEEARVLSNRLGRSDGFAGLVITGQTPLACRLETRPLAALEARLAARIHLRPIDADEAGLLLAKLVPGASQDLVDVERWHRDAAGNPRRLIRLALSDPSLLARLTLAEATVTGHATAPPVREIASPARPAPVSPPRLGPVKPPIRIEEGMIEVGWDAEPEALTAVETVAPTPVLGPAEEERAAEERVDDHYAALQAWREWARNQNRAAEVPIATEPTDSLDPSGPDLPPEEHVDEARPNVWVEGQHSFAPYGQLFSRLRPSKDAS